MVSYFINVSIVLILSVGCKLKAKGNYLLLAFNLLERLLKINLESGIQCDFSQEN